MAEETRSRRSCLADVKSQKLMFLMIFICSTGMWMTVVERMRMSTTFSSPPDLEQEIQELPGDNLDSMVPFDPLRAMTPQKHVFFLNTHKAGGSIVRNVLLRFARRNNLTVLLPKRGLSFSQSSKDYWDNRDVGSEWRTNHVLCDYLVFNQTFVTSLMPADTLYVGIVRDPFQQFLAAFHKYRRVLPPEHNYLRAIPGPVPEATYLQNPGRWETQDPGKSFTNNRMSFDFGLDVGQWGDLAAVQRYLEHLQNTFHLVMVAEKFDESLVLLRRLAHWSLRDILYVQVSDFEMVKRYTFTETQKQVHRQFQAPDYALYRRFEAILYNKISKHAFYGFYSELARFRDIRIKVQVFCEKKQKLRAISIKASEWNEAFTVTAEDCMYMTGMLPLVNRTLPSQTYNRDYYKWENQYFR